MYVHCILSCEATLVFLASLIHKLASQKAFFKVASSAELYRWAYVLSLSHDFVKVLLVTGAERGC